jgi:hypothetical protein
VRFRFKTFHPPDLPHPLSIRSVPLFQVPALCFLWTADSSVHFSPDLPRLKKSAQPRQNVLYEEKYPEVDSYVMVNMK